MTIKFTDRKNIFIFLLTYCLICFAAGSCQKKSDPQPAAAPVVDFRDSFIGTWNWIASATFTGGTRVPFYEGLTISKGTATNAVAIAFASGVPSITGTVTGNILTVVTQTVDGAVITGTMTFIQSVIDIKLTSTGNGTTSVLAGAAAKETIDFGASDLFAGDWKGTASYTCVPGSTTSTASTVTITSVDKANGITVRLLPNNITMAGTAAARTVTLPTQKVGGTTLEGTIKVSGSILTNNQALTFTFKQTSTNIFSTPPVTTVCNVTFPAKRI